MKIRSIKQKKQWRGQRVFLRVDFNVPIVRGRISEDYRIAASLPTIKYLQERGAKIIIASHFGDPKGQEVSLSTRILARRLQKLTSQKVKFVAAVSGDKVSTAVNNLCDGELLFLENLRFHPDEKKNSLSFAKDLSRFADIYVNDAFSVCHRAQASVSALSRLLPAFAGLQLEAEIHNLQKILKPKKPLVVVMGGAKISTKAPIIKKLYPLASQIILGGGLANTFWHYQGLEVGRSLHDDKVTKIVAPFFKKKKLLSKIILPVDVVVKTLSGQSLRRGLNDIKKSDCIFDVGPDSIALFSSYLKKAQTIVWNGPLGKFEENSYRHGTMAVAAVIASCSTGRAFGLVGGGETVAALKMTKMESYVDWVSTAGGAMLSYLGGEKMPGLKNIIL
jgi:phosphoglycerate kinase